MAELFSEKWVQWVALTTTILAVCAGLSTLKGGGNSTKTQLLTTQEANKWSYFQAKSIKQHVSETQKDLFEVMAAANPEAANNEVLKRKIASLDSNITRYNKEKSEIKKDAESLTVKQEEFKKHSANFGLATMILQIAIMLSSISALLKRKSLWYGGMALGLIGVFYMINGFLLFL